MKILIIIQLILIGVMILLGGLCTDYITHVAFDKDLPFIADIGIGVVTGEIVIIVALVCVIVEACDVETPFFNKTDPTTKPAK